MIFKLDIVVHHQMGKYIKHAVSLAVEQVTVKLKNGDTVYPQTTVNKGLMVCGFLGDTCQRGSEESM